MVAQNEFTKVLIHKRGTNLFFSGRHCFFRLISAMAVQNEFWESSITCTNGHASLLSITYKIVFGSLMSVQIVATYGSVPESGVGSTFKNISNSNLYKSPRAMSFLHCSPNTTCKNDSPTLYRISREQSITEMQQSTTTKSWKYLGKKAISFSKVQLQQDTLGGARFTGRRFSVCQSSGLWVAYKNVA